MLAIISYFACCWKKSAWAPNCIVSTGDFNDRSLSRFDCGNGLLIPIDQLCDGIDNCIGGARPGDDETSVLCDSKFELHVQLS